MRYSKKPKYDIWKISLEILEILSVSREFGIGIKKAIERIGKEKEISEESIKIISDENKSDDETKEGESSKPKEEIYETKENGVITIYVNRKGPYYIHKEIGKGAYKLRTLDGKVLKTSHNVKHVKKYYDTTNNH